MRTKTAPSTEASAGFCKSDVRAVPGNQIVFLS